MGTTPLTLPKHHCKVLYYNLLTSGKLRSHLADIEEQAQDYSPVSSPTSPQEGITEQLKATDQMKWVQKMNNIESVQWKSYVKTWCSYEKRKYYLRLTNAEHHFIIQSLLNYRNKLISQGKYTVGVYELIIKYTK